MQKKRASLNGLWKFAVDSDVEFEALAKYPGGCVHQVSGNTNLFQL